MEWESNEVTRIELLVGSGGLIISKGMLTLPAPRKDANQKASQEEGAQQSLTELAPVLRLPSFQTVRNKCLLFKSPSLAFYYSNSG